MTTNEDVQKLPKENENDALLNICLDTNSLDKKKLGNLYLFYYVNGNPLIVIGPHCKI